MLEDEFVSGPEGETPMTKAIRSWRRSRRFHATVRELSALSMRELAALGIVPTEISRLAYEASRI